MQVAVITGGASGMGLAVASALAQRGDWKIHLLDISEERGSQAAKELPNTFFHQADISNYGTLARTFDSIFSSSGNRLDFVFANAGVIERTNFYETSTGPSGGVAEPDLRTIQVNLNGVIYTTVLAAHYFRLSPHGGKGTSLVMTSSCGGLYPSHYSPIYTASKHGVLGFMRSVARPFAQDGIRVNAICPGIVKTNLVDAQGWSGFPEDRFIPVERIAEIVTLLIDGGEMVDTADIRVSCAVGRAVELSGSNYYFREQPEFCDSEMKEVMGATELENQVGAVLSG
ncbi:NAD(P)-binding protein [Aspergillus affinis]|uniref:NAD(P)-binding protein n=1 Tax=Aspergillus affinis TaxID=1070780 RepID=UPI0022FDC676|nr:NAD(P)-binding protein [Aspergillus affinis]KAI9041109.1 NAD(P)-binding protein [Aspergillus affinis]